MHLITTLCKIKAQLKSKSHKRSISRIINSLVKDECIEFKFDEKKLLKIGKKGTRGNSGMINKAQKAAFDLIKVNTGVDLDDYIDLLDSKGSSVMGAFGESYDEATDLFYTLCAKRSLILSVKNELTASTIESFDLYAAQEYYKLYWRYMEKYDIKKSVPYQEWPILKRDKIQLNEAHGN
jgi:hypothetical protein